MENLPVEILQPIFFLADHNIALLHASPRIAARLSSHYVYKSTCQHFLTNVLEDRPAQTAAQTCIFASRWMTWSFFKDWILESYGSAGCLCGMTVREGCFDPQWPPDFDNATNLVISRSHLPRLAFVKARIPAKLLCGPWSSDKVQFLQFLLWTTSMTVDWDDAETRQIVIGGRMQAIREGNLEAVELFNHNRRMGRTATLYHVRYAVFEGGCNRSIVYDTMLTASMWTSEASWDCAELDSWCERRISVDDPKGRWLKIKLHELRAKSHPGKIHRGSDLGYKQLPGGELNSETGDYDGGDDDQLVIKQHKSNLDIRQFGWFFQIFMEQKQGQHGVTREDLRNFWTYCHGDHHAIRGIYESRFWRTPPTTIWLDMWIPTSKCQGIGGCTCLEAEE